MVLSVTAGALPCRVKARLRPVSFAPSFAASVSCPYLYNRLVRDRLSDRGCGQLIDCDCGEQRCLPAFGNLVGSFCRDRFTGYDDTVRHFTDGQIFACMWRRRGKTYYQEVRCYHVPSDGVNIKLSILRISSEVCPHHTKSARTPVSMYCLHDHKNRDKASSRTLSSSSQ